MFGLQGAILECCSAQLSPSMVAKYNMKTTASFSCETAGHTLQNRRTGSMPIALPPENVVSMIKYCTRARTREEDRTFPAAGVRVLVHFCT